MLADAEIRAYRFGLIEGFLKGNGCDACAFTSADWFKWAGNHAVQELAWERPFLLVVTASGRTIGFLSELSRNQIASLAGSPSLWMDRVEFYAESPSAARRMWTTPKWPEMVAQALAEEGLAASCIAFDSISEPVRMAAQHLPKLRLRSAGPALRGLRHVKHPREIDTMQTAAALSDWAFARLRELLQPGCNLAALNHELAAQLSLQAARLAPRRDYLIGGIATLSGADSACPKGANASCAKVLQNDAIAVTAIATSLDGLAMELSRPWLVGKPPASVRRHFDLASRAQDAAIAAARPGEPLSGVHQAAQSVFDAQGMGDKLVLRAGHGVGVTLHDFPGNLPFNERPMTANEVLAIEPGIYIPRLGGFRFADTVLVAQGGGRPLTQFPKTADALALNEASGFTDQKHRQRPAKAPPPKAN